MTLASGMHSMVSLVRRRPLLRASLAALVGAAAGIVVLVLSWAMESYVQPDPIVVLALGAAMGLLWGVLIGSVVRPVPHGRVWKVLVGVFSVALSLVSITLLPYPESRASSAAIWYPARMMGEYFGIVLLASVFGGAKPHQPEA